jgi:hypothetical protein
MKLVELLKSKYLDDKYLTLAQVESLCPACASEMKANNLKYLTPSMLGITATFNEVTAKKSWKKLPKGWTLESAKSMWKKLAGKGKHKRTACMEKVKGKITNEGAFCNSLYQMFEA